MAGVPGVRFKAGVSITGARAELVLGLVLAEQVFRDWRAPLVVTSVMDGRHAQGSLHYLGLAADLRSKHLETELRERVLRGLEDTLGPLGFQVLLEDEGESNEHIHLEHDPGHVRVPVEAA